MKNRVVKDVISGIAVSMGVGAISNAIKITKDLYASFIDLGRIDVMYDDINKALFELAPTICNKYKVPSSYKDSYELNRNVMFFIKIDKHNYMKITTYVTEDTRRQTSDQRINIKFYGNNRHVNRVKLIKKALTLSSDKYIKVYHFGTYFIPYNVATRSFDSIILNDDTKHNIVDGLLTWKSNKKWYHDHNLVHKIGILLYGKPGTGKSSIIKAVSNMFSNAPIVMMSSENILGSISDLMDFRQHQDGVIIVIIEDFDMYFKSRECDDVLDKNPSDQNIIFQVLDGIFSMEDTIYIATTNYKERIDPALIRYGRFDIQEELKYFDYDTAVQYVKNFGLNEIILNELDIDYPIQPAYLQSKIMEYRSKNK